MLLLVPDGSSSVLVKCHTVETKKAKVPLVFQLAFRASSNRTFC